MVGSLLRDPIKLPKNMQRIVAALAIYLIFSVVSYFPYFLSYFNELVLPRTDAYEYLADSNIDWGQSEGYLLEYIQDHPKVIVHPDRPVSGTVIVSVNQLVGIWVGPEKYEWLRENYEPIGHVAYSYLIFEIPPSGSFIDD
jgi:hypothetical protein